MVCSRCGEAAMVKRPDGYYCGACALTRDWRELIAIVQDARVATPAAGEEDPVPESTADPFAQIA
jgi:RNA polymerase subunit RPABC4/transcription elongation factor Spt4